VYTIRMLLDPAFGQRLFEAAVRADNATTVEDSAFVKLDQFIKLFKGISVQAVQGDKIYGISPTKEETQMQLYFTLNGRQRILHYHAAHQSSFSTILSDNTSPDGQ